MDFDFDWVDAFTDQVFGGNGCAVVHGGAGLPDELCMAYVRETSLVECTFTGPSEVADFKVKYYLASREIPFAGHPTIATVAALRHRGLIGEGRDHAEAIGSCNVGGRTNSFNARSIRNPGLKVAKAEFGARKGGADRADPECVCWNLVGTKQFTAVHLGASI